MAPPRSTNNGRKKSKTLMDFFSPANIKRASELRAADERKKMTTKTNNSNKPQSSNNKKPVKPKATKTATKTKQQQKTTSRPSSNKSNNNKKKAQQQRDQRRTSLEDTDDEEMEPEWWEKEEEPKPTKRPRQASTKQKKRGLEDSSDDDNDDEESEFENNEEDDEEEDLVCNNDDNEDNDDKTPVRKRPKTSHSTTTSATRQPPPQVSSSKTPSRSLPLEESSLAQFKRKISMSPAPPPVYNNNNHSITPMSSRTQANGADLSQSSSSSSPTDKSVATPAAAPQPRPQPPKAPKPIKGAVNPMGSHVHNHLKFLHPPRDREGRTPDHTLYDCRTLRVSASEWQRVTGSSMTHAVQQWWDLKAQYFDTLLLFKTGKFYELYHMDADVGVKVLGLSYMKGVDAHAGFPEKAYGPKAQALVQAGYKVARVEQTETPDQLKQRKQRTPAGQKKPQVVNREVCSILSLGTRTCCYLDQTSGTTTPPTVGPLLVIAERELTTAEAGDGLMTREFGVTLVDAPRGWVTLGQFQDDAVCRHLQTLLAGYGPCEILYQGDHASSTQNSSSYHQKLKSIFTAYRHNATEPCRVEVIQPTEAFPKSTALDTRVRKQLQRPSPTHPWNVPETLEELQRRDYFGSDHDAMEDNAYSSWPPVLQSAAHHAEDNTLALSSLGAALFYLQRNLIDYEILSMGVVHNYTCPTSTLVVQEAMEEPLGTTNDEDPMDMQETEDDTAVATATTATDGDVVMQDETRPTSSHSQLTTATSNLDAMTLEGTTLHNLEVLASAHDNQVAGSLWSQLSHTKTPHGTRLLRAWLLRPLFQKEDIDRRARAVEELTLGAAAAVRREARKTLAACGDIERLLSRVHTMSGTTRVDDNASPKNAGVHPNERAVYYEEDEYTRRKVGDFAKALKGLEEASAIPGIFQDVALQSPLLTKVVRLVQPQGGDGRFPDIREDLRWFQDNFDADVAAQGQFEPASGVDQLFDEAQAQVSCILQELETYKREKSRELNARSDFKYINIKVDSKDKYLIELPAVYPVPTDWIIKGKRGKGPKQVNKYRTPEVEQWVVELEAAYDTVAVRRAKALEVMFARFDAKRDRWAAVAHATAILDALCSLSQLASEPGYTRPEILEYQDKPVISFRQARHPSVDCEFIPNDLSLGTDEDPERVLLLSGPNMGGKSTLLRQTCLLSILAQIGSFVPAEACALTPVDRIFTRLGAADRLLLGQSTFFVELSETASALCGATDRSLVIMDELGRGTSTFDGTAIAHATVKALVERNQCLMLFATHYHTLLDDWAANPKVRLGHMECLVEDNEVPGVPSRVTFLYSLGRGACPKSFGVNVAQLAGLPTNVLVKAGFISRGFESEMKAGTFRSEIEAAIHAKDWERVRSLWEAQSQRHH